MSHVYELGAPRIHTSHASLDHDVEMSVVHTSRPIGSCSGLEKHNSVTYY